MSIEPRIVCIWSAFCCQPGFEIGHASKVHQWNKRYIVPFFLLASYICTQWVLNPRSHPLLSFYKGRRNHLS